MTTSDQINRINKIIYWMMEREQENDDEISDKIADAFNLDYINKRKISDIVENLYGVDGCNYVICVGDDAPLEVFSETIESVINSRLKYPRFLVWEE